MTQKKATTAPASKPTDAKTPTPQPVAKSPIVKSPDGQIVRKFRADMLPPALRKKWE